MKSRSRLRRRHYHPKILFLVFVMIFGVVLLRYGMQLYDLWPRPRPAVPQLPTPAPEQPRPQPSPTPVPGQTYHIPILMYHYVEIVQDKNDTIRQSLNVSPAVFEKQIVTLRNAGYTFLTMAQVGEVLDGKRSLPSKPVVLTFDDGHWDLATDILPVLKKYNVSITAYIIPGFIGRSDFLSKKQFQQVRESGLVEIGAHTVHHVNLKFATVEHASSEIRGSKKMLEQAYSVPNVVSFAYPYGAFNEKAVQITREAGYTTAVSTMPGTAQSTSNRMTLFRLRPGARTGQTLLSLIESSSGQHNR